MRIAKIFKEIQFRKVGIISFIDKYTVDKNNKINHTDFICDECKRQEYSVTENIYFHFSFKGYCEECYNILVDRKRFLK